MGVKCASHDGMGPNVDIPFNVEVCNVWKQNVVDEYIIVPRECVRVRCFACRLAVDSSPDGGVST